MAANQVHDQVSDMVAITIDDVGGQGQEVVVDYAKRARWLRSAVVGAFDGLLFMASLIMMKAGAAKMNFEAMILDTAVAAFVMGVGELVSVYSQRDIRLAQMNREGRPENMEAEIENLPNPLQEAGALTLAFVVGAFVPLLGAFVKNYGVRVGVVLGIVSSALFAIGGLCAVMGNAPVVTSSLRMLLGGWVAMALPFALIKLVGST